MCDVLSHLSPDQRTETGWTKGQDVAPVFWGPDLLGGIIGESPADLDYSQEDRCIVGYQAPFMITKEGLF